MPPRPDIEAVAEEVFTALADPSRRGILAALAAGGPATATDLAARLPISRQPSPNTWRGWRRRAVAAERGSGAGCGTATSAPEVRNVRAALAGTGHSQRDALRNTSTRHSLSRPKKRKTNG